MPIVPQPNPFFYSPFLALPAPHIAGLLPAGTLPNQPPIDSVAPYIFDRPALADLTVDQRTRLCEATDMLLEIAIEHLLGNFDENVLRAAEVIFHRAAGGKSPLRQVGPAAFHAELDADWLTIIADSKRIKPMSTSEAESVVAAVKARGMGGVA